MLKNLKKVFEKNSVLNMGLVVIAELMLLKYL